jgi:hypothetical protein
MGRAGMFVNGMTPLTQVFVNLFKSINVLKTQIKAVPEQDLEAAADKLQETLIVEFNKMPESQRKIAEEVLKKQGIPLP